MAERPQGLLDDGFDWLANATKNVLSATAKGSVVGVEAVNDYVLKPVIREAMAASLDAGALFTWSLGNIYDTANPKHFGRTTASLKGRSRGEFLQDFGGQFITSNRAGLQGLGEGYLPRGSATVTAEAGIQKVRPRVGSHAFTPGRMAAYPLVALGVVPEDSVLHQIISGGVDAFAVIKNPADMFNWIPAIHAGGTGATSMASAGKTRIANADEFGKYFNDLEDRALSLMNDTNSPLTNPKDAKVLDEYNRLVQPVETTRTKPFPKGSINSGRIADTYEPSDVYNYWKNKVEVAYGDAANNAGVIRDAGGGMIQNQYKTWRSSGEGTAWANTLIEKVRGGELDLQTLWKTPMFKRQGLQTANRLVKELKNPAATSDDVFKILDESVSSFDPSVNVRNLGASRGDLARTGQGINIKTQAQKWGWRQLEVMPESLKVGRTDPAQSARNLDDLMGAFKFGYQERGEWLGKFADAVQGSKADMFNFLSEFTGAGVRSRIAQKTVPFSKQQIFSNDQIRVMTSWAGKVSDEVVNWTKNDLGQVVPLPWIDNFGSGVAPLRNTQLLVDDHYLLSPEFLDEIIQVTGDIGVFVKASKTVPVVGGVVKGVEATTDLLHQYMSRMWKPSRVAKPSHLLRVVPEETIRAVASGIFEHPMEQMLAVLGRTLKVDAKGVPLVGKIPKYVQMNTDLASLEMTLMEAKGYLAQTKFIPQSGADFDAFKQLGGLTKRQQKLVDRIPEIQTKISDLEAKLAADQSPITESLIGPRSRGGTATATGEWVPAKHNMLRQGTMQLPDRTISTQRGAWVKGITHELASMADNPDYARIAVSKLRPKDLITVGDKTLTIDGHVAAGTIHPFTGQPIVNDLDAVKLWLFQGDGRKQFESYFENVANLREGFVWDDYTVASSKVQIMLDDIISKTGGDAVLNEIVATKKFDGVRAVMRNPHTGRGDASKPLREYLSKTFINEPHAPRMVEFYPSNMPGGDGAASGLLSKGLDKLFNLYFEDMYGRVSDFASRSPVWKAGYWTRMEELVAQMTPVDAKKVVAAATKAKLTPTRLERIELQAALANGEGNLKGATLLAEAYAKQFSKDLLFDASKRTLFGRQHWILFPFFEAFREVTGTWLKLAAQNPRVVRNTGQFVGTAQDEGWFYTDDNGRKVFEIPMTGAMVRSFVGTGSSMIQNFTVGVNSINIAGQMRPGIGPVLQVASDMMLPKNGDYDWLRNMISPFGDPGTENFQLQSLWAPKYLKQLFAETQSAEGVWAQVSKAALGDVKKDDYFQRALVRIMQHNINTNEHLYVGVDGMKRLYADSEAQALRLVTVRGLAAFSGPGAPMTTWLAHTKEGVVEVGVLADDLYTRETAAMNRGESRVKGFESWINYWGEQVWPYVSSLTESTVGGQIGTAEFERWARKNEPLLEKYPLLGGYLGPRDGVRNFDAWAAQMDAGRRKIVDPKQAIAKAQNRLGKQLYTTFLEGIPVEARKTAPAQQAIADKMLEIEARLPGWGRPGSSVGEFASETRTKIAELRSMVADKTLASNPVIGAVGQYLAHRDTAIKAMITADGSVNQKNWMTVKSAAPLRDYLVGQAALLVAATPAFGDVWDQVLSYEFQVGG